MVGSVLALYFALKPGPLERLKDLSGDITHDDANLTLNNFDYNDVREGQAGWSIHAATARYFDDSQETVLSQVNAVFFLKDGNRIALQGEKGVLHNDSKNMEIMGNVRVSYGDGYQLLTDRLFYERHGELLHTPAAVRFEGEGITLNGLGMRLEMGRQTLSILKNIETTLQGLFSY